MFINHGTFYPYYVFLYNNWTTGQSYYDIKEVLGEENSWIKWWILETLRCSTYFIIAKNVYYK